MYYHLRGHSKHDDLYILMKNFYLSILDLTVKVFKLHDKKVVVSGSFHVSSLHHSETHVTFVSDPLPSHVFDKMNIYIYIYIYIEIT